MTDMTWDEFREKYKPLEEQANAAYAVYESYRQRMNDLELEWAKQTCPYKVGSIVKYKKARYKVAEIRAAGYFQWCLSLQPHGDRNRRNRTSAYWGEDIELIEEPTQLLTIEE